MPVSQDELIEAGIAHGLIDRETVSRLRIESRQHRQPLLETVSRHGRFPVAALYRAVAETRGLRFVDLGSTVPPADLITRLPEALVRRRLVVPYARENGSVWVATADPDDRPTLESIERIFGQPLQLAMADPESLQQAVERALSVRSVRAGATAAAAAVEFDAVAALEQILSQAFLRRASDVHLEPVPHGMQVRFRIDGRLHTHLAGLHPTAAQEIVSRVKVLAGLDIAEQRAPQDGRIGYRPPGGNDVEIDVRVATVPTRWGERATLRLLASDADDMTLEKLGMSERDLKRFREVICRPYGIILLTGPTGSGKTTTLYAALREINQPHLNILTVEDPIEYLIPGVSQVHVGGTDKVTFASALRALLRHDPDVLMVGEIRDYETADVAIKAAMTGHLLFSTLHTNSACGAVTRLADLGCEPFLVGATLAGAIAQRLVRRLCPRCKRPRRATDVEAELLGASGSGVEICEPAGCARCLGTGYYGRIGLFEPLWVDAELSRLISRGVSEAELIAHTAGSLTTLRADGFAKVLSGTTSLEEVLATTIADTL